MTPATWKIICIVLSALLFVLAGAVYGEWIGWREEPLAFVCLAAAAFVAHFLP